VRIAAILVAILLLPLRALAVECPPSDKIKLANSGYTKDKMAEICATAAPLFRSAVAVNLHTSLVDAVAEAMMPIEVPVAGIATPLTLSEARYCGPASGVTSPHVAQLVAVATSDPSAPPAAGRVRPSSALLFVGCGVPLEQLASRFVPDSAATSGGRSRRAWSCDGSRGRFHCACSTCGERTQEAAIAAVRSAPRGTSQWRQAAANDRRALDAGKGRAGRRGDRRFVHLLFRRRSYHACGRARG